MWLQGVLGTWRAASRAGLSFGGVFSSLVVGRILASGLSAPWKVRGVPATLEPLSRGSLCMKSLRARPDAPWGLRCPWPCPSLREDTRLPRVPESARHAGALERVPAKIFIVYFIRRNRIVFIYLKDAIRRTNRYRHAPLPLPFFLLIFRYCIFNILNDHRLKTPLNIALN